MGSKIIMKKKRLTHFLLAASASLALFGCKPSEPETEMKAVEQFRTMLAASQYHEIYLASSEMLKKGLGGGTCSPTGKRQSRSWRL